MFKNYRYGGICAILTAVISLPTTFIYIASMFSSNEQYAFLSQVFLAVHTGILSCLFLFILTFMEDKLDILNAKWLIYCLIGTSALIGIPAIFISVHNTELYVYYTLMSTGLTVVYGIFSILLGQKMMKSPNKKAKHASSAGMWFTITGILMATYILSPFALLTGLVIDVYLALMFFAKESDSIEDHGTNSAEIA